MSAIMSFRDASGIYILTDAAHYDDQGQLTRISRKIDVSQRVPAAVATRGCSREGWVASKYIIDLIEREGFDAGMSILTDLVPSAFALKPDSSNRLEVLIAGVSERNGPQHLQFTNIDLVGGCPAMRLNDPGSFFSGVNGDGADRNETIEQMGGRKPYPGEALGSWVAATGGPVFNWYRQIPIPPSPWSKARMPRYLIGGQVDLTLVTPSGVSTRTIHRWPEDKVGEKIQPHRRALNRHERRALRRAA